MKNDNPFFSHKIYRALLLAIGTTLIATACAPRVKPLLFPITDRTAACATFLQTLDKAVFEAGVNNAAVFRLDGFPYLRADRFLCGLQDRVTSPAEKDLWIDWMLAEDIMARYAEISCLSPEVRRQLARQADITPSVEALAEYAASCADKLLTAHRRQPDFYQSVSGAVDCAEEYSTAMRVAGLYPLAALPVAFLTAKAQKRMNRQLNQPAGDMLLRGTRICYLPENRSVLSTEEIGRIIHKASDNALAVPRPDAAAMAVLAAAFAPVLTQEICDKADRPGAVKGQEKGFLVDGDRPTIYYYFTNAFYKKSPVLQINYAVWYPARKGPGAPWIERGPLDGLTVRFSLEENGRPVMVDVMNNCGCYHFFVPAGGTVKTVKSQPLTTDAFAPVRLPEAFPDNPLNIHVNADWHQVVSISADPPPAKDITYRLVPYQTLEMLPGTADRHESLFNESGIAKGSERIEPFILFSMGIPKVGSMRQRGHHALKLVGRSYFSDPDLFDQNFEFAE